MPVFSAVDAASFAVAPPHLMPSLPVEDGRPVTILADRRNDGPEA